MNAHANPNAGPIRAGGRICFTVFKTNGSRLTKQYQLVEDGSVRTELGTQFAQGSCRVVEFDDADPAAALAEIGRVLDGLSSSEAIGLGVPLDGSTERRVTTKDRYAQGDTDAIPRALEHFGWPGGPGLLLLDGDDIDGLQAVLSDLYPNFAQVALLCRASASASVIDPRSGKALKTGEHGYVVIDDPTRSKACLDALMRLAWCRGHGKSAGWLKLSKSGQALIRGAVDASVGSPERLSYEGAAVLSAGLTPLPRIAQVIGGKGMLCADDLLEYAARHAPEDRFVARVTAAKNDPDFREKSDALKAAFRKEHIRQAVARSVARGEPSDVARKRVAADYDAAIAAGAAKTGKWTFLPLTDDFVLHWPNGESFTVADIKKDPAAFHNQECCDPVEGMQYQSRNCAIIYTDGSQIKIYSRAHGDAFAYTAPLDEVDWAELFARIEAARSSGSGDELGDAAPYAVIEDEDEEDQAPKPKLADIACPDIDWTRPEGTLGEITDYTLKSSPWPNRPMAVAAAITTLSAVCGRWLYGPTGTALGVYLVCLADTTTGKDWPLGTPERVLRASGLTQLHTTGKAFSVSALEQMMVDRPCCVATVDEIGASLFGRMTNRGANANEQDMRGFLLELWSRNQFKGPFGLTKRAAHLEKLKLPIPKAIPRPNLTLFGVSGARRFWESIGPGSIQDGFLNRFLIVIGASRGEPHEVSEEDCKVPQAIAAALRQLVPVVPGLLAGVFGVYDLKVHPDALDGVVRRLPWDSDEVRERAHAFQKQVINVADNNPEEKDLVGRVYEYAVRLSSLHAVSRAGPDARVAMRDLEWGIALSLHSARALIVGAGRHMAENEQEAKFNRIRNVIMDARRITRSELLRQIRSINARELNEIITHHLIGAGWVRKVRIKTKGRTAEGWEWI